MTHFSGIKPSEKLVEKFSGLKDDLSVRGFSVLISNEEMTFGQSFQKQGSWKDDFSSLIKRLQDDSAVYFLLRLDDEEPSNWTLINWIPENCSVNDRMIYASSRFSLKRIFGDNDIKYDINAKDKTDLEIQELSSMLNSVDFSEEKKEINSHGSFGLLSKTTNFVGLGFEPTSKLLQSLEDFKNDKTSFLQIIIKDERLDLVESRAIFNIEEFTTLDKNESRYFLFKYKSKENQISTIFLYYNSSFKTSIKDRMLYTSGKASLISFLKNECNLNLELNLEVDEYPEITDEYLDSLLNPTKEVRNIRFQKPKPPGRNTRNPN